VCDVKEFFGFHAGEMLLAANVRGAVPEIGKPSQRPAVAYVLLAVHRKSEMPLFADVLPVEESLEHLFGQVPRVLLARLAAMPLRPREIRVQNHFLVNLLEPVLKELGTKIVHKWPLKTLGAVKSALNCMF